MCVGFRFKEERLSEFELEIRNTIKQMVEDGDIVFRDDSKEFIHTQEEEEDGEEEESEDEVPSDYDFDEDESDSDDLSFVQNASGFENER